MAEYDQHHLHQQQQQQDSPFFGRRYIETSGQVLGLCTPASRLAQTAAAELPAPLSSKYPQSIAAQEQPAAVNMTSLSLEEGEIMKGLHVNDALLPSRRHLIKEVSGLIDYSDNLILSLASLRVLAQISQLHQYEPDPNLSGVAPNRLFSILQEEPGKLEQIRRNFRRRLEREESENVQFLADGRDFPHLISTWLLLNAQGEEIERIMSPDFMEAFGLTNYIRLFMVNFFAVNVGKASFNLAHYILGFAQESQGIDSQGGCLSLLIDMLMYGLGHASVEAPVIFIEHPALGVKLLAFLRALLSAPVHFSAPAWEYLRNDRDLFHELAASINTRLLQVSFSADKGYALSSSEFSEAATIRSSEFHFSVFELQQKTELFQILAMDLHESFVTGQDALYLEKMLRTLLKSNELGESRIIDFLAAIDGITEEAYLKRLRSSQNENCGGEFEAALVAEFEVACAAYIESLALLIGQVLAILIQVEEMSKEFDSFVESLQVWLWKFMRKSGLSVTAIESLVQLNVLISDSGKFGAASLFSSSQDSLDAQIAVLLRPEINATTRCFLYTSLMSQSTEAIGEILSEDRFLRLVELVTRDASNSSVGALNDSLVTVALANLEFLNRARPDLLQDALLSGASTLGNSLHVPTAINSTAPFIPGLLSSLTVDDAVACAMILNTFAQSSVVNEEDFSVFLKWRAKWSLLLNLTVREHEQEEIASSSGFAHRFIDGGFLDSVIFKFKCLSLQVAHRLESHESGHLVLLTIFPVLKFLCALAMATGRQMAVASRLVSLFCNSDVFEAMTLICSFKTSESLGSLHAHVLHYILLLVNGVLQVPELAACNLPELNSKLVSFRHAVLKQVNWKSAWIHHFGRISAGNLTFVADEERLLTEIQVLEQLMVFLAREPENSDLFIPQLSFEFGDRSIMSSLSLGTLVFLIKTCSAKLQEGRERADLLKYFTNNRDTLSPSDLAMLGNVDMVGGVQERIDEIYGGIVELQGHLVSLVEKASFLLLKHLRSKLSPINASGYGAGTMYVDSRSPQVQAARALKTDASIMILPVLDAYHKKIRLVDSTANSSLYMSTMVKDFSNLLLKNNNAMYEL